MAVAISSTLMWVFGGRQGTQRLNDVWIFNTVTSTWNEVVLSNGPSARDQATATVYLSEHKISL